MTLPTALPAGQELKVTSTIIFVSGPHAGTHTITQVLSATQFVTDRPFISSEGYGYWYLVQGCFVNWIPGSGSNINNPPSAPWDPINENIATGWRAKVGFANGAIPLAPPKESFQSVANNGANKCRITANGHRLLAGLEINVIGGSYAGVHVITAVINDNQFDTDRAFTGSTAAGDYKTENSTGPTEWRLNFKKGSAEHVGHLLPQYRVAYWRVKSTGAIVTSF